MSDRTRYRWWKERVPLIKIKFSRSILHRFSDPIGASEGLTINPYVGCMHRCIYCYATYEWVPEFYDVVQVKVNAPDILSRELSNLKDRNHPVFIASATDCYQPYEGIYKLTRKCVEVLQKKGVPYIILTKSGSIVRDLDLHARYKDRCIVAWSLTTLDSKVKKIIEPNASSPEGILKALSMFSKAGIVTGINVDPIIPGVNDDEAMLRKLVREVRDNGAKFISASVLRLRDDIWDRMRNLMESKGMVGELEKLKEVYFSDPFKLGYYFLAKQGYVESVMGLVKRLAEESGLSFGFPTRLPYDCNTSDSYEQAQYLQCTLL